MPARAHALKLAIAAAIVIAAYLASVPVATAVSSSTTVTMDVDSVLVLDVGACAAGQAGVTDLGTVLAGDWLTSSADCTIEFGSNVGASALRARQADGAGRAMFRPSTGKPDPGFAASGSLVFDPWTAGGQDEARAAIQLEDGSLLVGGIALSGTARAFISKYDIAGGIDTSFGGGTVLNSYTSGSALEGVTDMVRQVDGKIVSISDSDDYNYVLHRFLASGGNDTTFGTSNGQRRALPCGSFGASHTLDIDATGRVVVAGECQRVRSTLQRWTATGAADATFANAAGNLEIDFCPDPGGGLGGEEALADVLVLADGALAAVGWCEVAANSFDAQVVRVRTDGTLDPSFGTGGRIAIDFGTATDRAYVLAQQADGALVVAGGGGDGRFQLRRIDAATGATDSGFGSAGIVALPVGSAGTTAYVRGIALEYDGRILVAGDARIGSTRDQVLMRLLPSGAPDASFNATGTLVIQHGSTDDYAYDVASAADGQIIVAGATVVGSARRATVTRLDSDTIPQIGGSTSRWSDRTDGFFAMCVRAVAGGATADSVQWPATVAGTCTTGPSADPDWAAVPTATGIELARTPALGGRADIGFAMAAAEDQSPGSFVAPIEFELVAVS
jgi:uncharacterized delta-60 repeat protein